MAAELFDEGEEEETRRFILATSVSASFVLSANVSIIEVRMSSFREIDASLLANSPEEGPLEETEAPEVGLEDEAIGVLLIAQSKRKKMKR